MKDVGFEGGGGGWRDKRAIPLNHCPQILKHSEDPPPNPTPPPTPQAPPPPLWKSTAFLPFIATASHVNDQFSRNAVINIRRSRGGDEYSGGRGSSEGLKVNLQFICLWVKWNRNAAVTFNVLHMLKSKEKIWEMMGKYVHYFSPSHEHILSMNRGGFILWRCLTLN